jgi:hypothetical protein
MIVKRMKELQVQKPQALRLDRKTADRTAGAVVIGFRPAVPPLDDAEAVRPRQMQLPEFAADRQRFDIGIARQQQMPVKRLEEIRPAHARIRLAHQRKQRMLRPLAIAFVKQPRHRGGGFGDQPDAAMRHRVLHEAFSRQRRIGSPRPACAPVGRQRHQAGGGLLFRHGFALRRGAPRQQ